MPAVEASAVVPLDPERAFALAHELGERRAAWDAETIESRLIRGAQAQAEGASRFEKSRSGRRLILRTSQWAPPLASACTMAKGPAWLRDYGESVRVRPLPEGGSRVTWKIAATPVAPVLPGVVGGAIAPTLRAQLERRMAGFEAAARRLAELDPR